MRIAKPWFRRASQTWYVQLNGKQISLGKEKTAAWSKYVKLVHERGGRVDDVTWTVHAIIDAYVEWLRDNRAESACEISVPRLLSLRQFLIDMPADKIKPYHVDQWIRKVHKDNSPTTIYNCISLVQAMFNWAKSYGYVEANPVHGMPKPTPKMRQDFVPPERFAELVDCIQDACFRDFALFMLETGARAQEMLTFQACHLDGSRLVLEIEDSKGNKQSRVVYMPAAAQEIAERYAAMYPDGALFRSSCGRAWNKDSINKHFRRLKVKMNMPRLCATTLRHSFAHARLVAGQDALTVSKLMGHRNLKMLSSRYGHLEGSTYLADEASRINPLQTALAGS